MALSCTNLVSSRSIKGLHKHVSQLPNRIKLNRAEFSSPRNVCSRFTTCCYQGSNNCQSRTQRMLKNRNSLFNPCFRSISTHHTKSSKQSEPGDDDKVYTHFGYETVEENEKVEKVYNVFENVAKSYDLMNDAMSMGMHRLWKTKFVEQLKVRPTMKVLDMAGGTGDIAFKIFDDFASRYPKGSISVEQYPEIIISDINQSMLDVGRDRATKLGIDNLFQWVQADAEELPFEDESFDLYTISFGIRNATHIDKVLEEAFRVLKIGGRLSCLEFSSVENPIIREIYDNYSFEVIPVMGQVLAQDWTSYQYLVESIRRFPKQEDFADLIYNCGFSNVRFENLTHGVVAVHDAFKI